MRLDFGRTVDDYAKYRAEVPAELYDRLARGFHIGLSGQRVLDVGTGTGAVARALARRGCEVTGLDPSSEMLAAARRLATGGPGIRFVEGIAEATGLPADSFDVVTAAVCWHWFDGERAAAEIRRVLVPGGWLVIVHFNGLSRPGNVVEATELLIKRYRRTLPGTESVEGLVRMGIARFFPAWVGSIGTGINPASLETLTVAGFANLETFSFDVDIPYRHEAWRGRIRSHAFVGASQPLAAVARLDADLGALLREKFRDDPMWVPHRVFAIVARKPPASAA